MNFVIVWSIALGLNLISIIYSVFCPWYLKTQDDNIGIKLFRKKYHITKNQIVSVEHYTCNFLEAILYWFIEGGPLNTTIKYRDDLGSVENIYFICTTKAIKKIFPNVIMKSN